MDEKPHADSSDKSDAGHADDVVTIRNECNQDISPDSISTPLSRSPTVHSATTTLLDNISREPQEVLPSDVIFAFGPFDYYFMYQHRSSGIISARGAVNGHSSPDTMIRIGRTYAFAFSPHGDEIAAYRDKETNAITWSFVPSRKPDAPSYQSLRKWLELNVPMHDQAAMLDLKVVFGSRASYFASTSSECTHHDLPPRLADEIDDRMSRGKGPPMTIALGDEATYFAAWGSRCIWSLNESNSLREKLHDKTTSARAFANIYLDPTNKKHYVAVMKDGWITFSATDTKGIISRHVAAHMQTMANEFGRTYDVKFLGRIDRITCISPDTNFTHEETLVQEQEKQEGKTDTEEKNKEEAVTREDLKEVLGMLTTLENSKKGGFLSRVFRRKSVALQ